MELMSFLQRTLLVPASGDGGTDVRRFWLPPSDISEKEFLSLANSPEPHFSEEPEPMAQFFFFLLGD
jgi:hypothetical protein